MTARVAVHHRTRYRYRRPVSLSPQDIRLRPDDRNAAVIETYRLAIAPRAHRLTWYEDAYRNHVARALFAEPVSELALDVELVASLATANPFDFLIDEHAARLPFEYSEADRQALAAFLDRERGGPAFGAWLETVRRELLGAHTDTVGFLVSVNRALAKEIRYRRRAEPGVRLCETTLVERNGSCRDSGWLLVQTLRHLGIAARYTSGYLIQLGADDSVDLHAWCEAYVPGAGWIGLDPTSGLLTAEGHLRLAVAAQPAETAPVHGYAQSGESKLSVEMRVRRLSEAPRIEAESIETKA